MAVCPVFFLQGQTRTGFNADRDLTGIIGNHQLHAQLRSHPEGSHQQCNALAIVSGIVCDGAKASCAAKIAAAVDAGILGYNMYIRGQQFRGGDGIVSKGVENTLQNVGRLGKDGMKETNEEIIKIMIEA